VSLKGERAAAEQAETLALRALAFIAADEERFQRFLASSGTTPDDVRRRAADPDFLAGVYDHMLADEALLVAFADAADIAPEKIVAARYRLPGAVMD
jgi:Protein of unknown function (DUF3572)